MEKILRPEVGGVLVLAGNEGARVDFGNRLAGDGPFRWRSDWIGVGKKLRESFATGEFGVGDRLP